MDCKKMNRNGAAALTVPQLKQEAKQKKIKGYYKMSRHDLCKALGYKYANHNNHKNKPNNKPNNVPNNPNNNPNVPNVNPNNPLPVDLNMPAAIYNPYKNLKPFKPVPHPPHAPNPQHHLHPLPNQKLPNVPIAGEQKEEEKEKGEECKAEDRPCCVCSYYKITHACNPCGHFIFCGECVWEFKRTTKKSECPVCRKKISSYLKIFYASDDS